MLNLSFLTPNSFPRLLYWLPTYCDSADSDRWKVSSAHDIAYSTTNFAAES